jgi:hypothetical protein
MDNGLRKKKCARSLFFAAAGGKMRRLATKTTMFAGFFGAVLVFNTCKTGSQIGSFKETMYIKPVQGVRARKVGEDYSPKDYHIAYNTHVTLIDRPDTPGYKYGQRQIIWNNEYYNVFAFGLSEQKDSQYFRIVTKAGLNLRDQPGLKGKVLMVIPFLATGRVVAVHPQTQKIQDRTGYWLQINYQAKTGWIFSGFVITGDDPDSIKLENRKLEVHSPEMTVAEDWVGEKEATKFAEVDGIKKFHYKKAPDDCSKSANVQRMGVLVQNTDGSRLSIKGDIEEPVQTNIQAPGLIITFHQHCICCCPNGSFIIYLKQKTRIVPYMLELGKSDAGCGGMDHEAFSETRMTADKTKILMLVKVPICQGTYVDAESMATPERIKNVEYSNGVFVIYDLTNGTIQKQEALAVPKQYSSLWDSGFLLVAIPRGNR